ncbi:nephrin-like [Mytilus trossulus]|uniref:nephrin-like n=1 Tax=Mytilus trossulus TaxID=6551 RepID=UPI003003DD81
MVQRWPTGYMTPHLLYQFNGSPRGVTVNNKLTIHTLTKLDKGKDLSCQATDDLQKTSIKSDAVTLDPYYGPDNVVLKPGNTALNITERTTLGPIDCSAICYPKCLFEWKTNRTGTFKDVLSNETLVLANIKENQAGIYRCLVFHPSNTTRLIRTDISVNVQYSPKIESLWLSDKNETYGSGRPPTYSFSEGNHLTITLRIKSNPDPQIVINSSMMTFSTLLYTKQSDYFTTNLPSLKCENSGNFAIHASNGIAYGDNRTVTLKIKCKPRDVKTNRKIGTKVNTDVNIVMDVISFPAPTVTWLHMTTFRWTVLKDKYDYKHIISSTIRITSKDDFREYGIQICNTLGCIVENITLQPEDKPEAPLNFSVETTTFRSASLSWIVGFNGGHEQTFSVKFKTTDSDEDTKIVHTSDTKTGSKVYYILDQLKPDTLYHVMVLSTNKHGNRNASLQFKTEVEYIGKSTSKTTSISTLSIVLVCGYPVLFAVIIVLLVFINRRNKCSTGGSNPTNINSTTSDEYTVIQRGNPTFTEPYSTLQSPTESTALHADRMETDTYDECGIITDVEVNQTIDNRKSGNSKDKQESVSGKEQTKERLYANTKI